MNLEAICAADVFVVVDAVVIGGGHHALQLFRQVEEVGWRLAVVPRDGVAVEAIVGKIPNTIADRDKLVLVSML